MASSSDEAQDTIAKSQDSPGTGDETSPIKSSESTKAAKSLQSLANVEQSVAPSEAKTRFTMDDLHTLRSLAEFKRSEALDEPSLRSLGDLNTANDLMEWGSVAFAKRDFTEAAESFKLAFIIRALHHDNLGPECAVACYKHALSLLYEVPVPSEDDPLADVPKEVDYQPHANKDGTITAAKQDGNLTHSDGDSIGSNERGDGSENVDIAQDELELAWRIISEQQGDSMEKVDILSALGEVAYDKVLFPSSLEYYRKALSILERLVEPDSQRLAHLKFKMGLCMEQCSLFGGAILFCQQAIQVCSDRLGRLMNELNTSSGMNATNSNQDFSSLSSVDPSTLEKQAEIRRIRGVLDKFRDKLDYLQRPPSPFTPVTFNSPGNLDLHSAEETVQTSTPTDGGDFNYDSPTASTARSTGTSHRGDAGRAKRRLLTEPGSAESTPTKKPSIDPSAEKGEGSRSAASTPTKNTSSDSLIGKGKGGAS